MELSEDKAKVIRYFLKNTPVGEHSEVIKDLTTILGHDAVHSEVFADFLAEHLSEHGTVINHEGTNLMLTSLGRNGFTFFDPKVSTTFDVNPYDLTASNIAQVASGTTFSSILQEKLDAYLSAHFSETAQARVFQNEEGAFIVISCSSVNLRNMWTGEWLADWKFAEGTLTGTIKFNAHYFEEGNLQCMQIKEVEKKIVASSEEAGAEAILKAIKEADNLVQAGMKEVYDNLPQNTFKRMRRTMPVTQVKFAEMYKTKMFS